ncbi:hypothetical protein [Algoriphagus sp. NG3]|uniref:hypothetical protein n=1 Tax=unclassified Algoriphagus TaxID=2641541 RepID=UPI002A82AE68|nr:hypothetical protein [Algoriphagus sp. NG3]WPR74616.1 hypothetical protein SLW71_18290 [Algoriphagus sp. NG3]
MKISSSKGRFKVIQTIKNRDELLILGSWSDLVRIFDSNRTFLVNKQESIFGIFLCKQECAEFMTKIIQEIDYHEWEDFTFDRPVPLNQFQA